MRLHGVDREISLHTSVNDVLYHFIFAIKGVG